MFLGGDICTLFSGARGRFSRSRLRDTQGGRLYTTRRKFGSRPSSVARALSVQSREKSGKSSRGPFPRSYESRARQCKTHISAVFVPSL